MGSATKKGVKSSKGSDKKTKAAGQGIKGTAKGFLDEAEKTGTALVGEVKELFDNLAQKVSSAATSAADTTASVADKVTIKDPAELVRGLLQDVKDAGEASMRMIGKGFDELRDKVVSSSEKASAGKPRAKKATVKKKAAKKTTTQKVAKKAAKKTAKKVAKKKTTMKVATKKVAKKKSVARKKAASQKARVKA